MNSRKDTLLIVSPDSVSMEASVILGTGGWLPPEQREALDWMTFGRIMGWRVILITPENFRFEIIEEQNIKWLIFSGSPDSLEEDVLNRIFHAVNNKPVLFISPVGKIGGRFEKHTGIHLSDKIYSGNIIQWKGTGNKKCWDCRNTIQMQTLEWKTEYDTYVTMGGAVLVAGKRIGFGKLAVLSFQPSSARDLEGSFTALLKHLLIMESLLPVTWLNWENTLILRMDDPGSLEPVYNGLYQNTKLNEQEWEIIGRELKKKNARISLGYVPGWVDDGNAERGRLEVDGRLCSRIKGKIYLSHLVKYEMLNDNNNHRIYDYQAEFRGIQKLRNEGLADVELHGYTHLHPDRIAWANATDRYLNTSWYREFGTEAIEFIKSTPGFEHPLHSGIKAFLNSWNVFPTTLICPGDKFTNDVLEKALQAGLMIVSSYYLCIRIENKLCWAQHICAPYLNEPDPSWFDSGLPVVGYFHDFDISINGTNWFSNYLDEWENAGANYFMDFREVSALLNHYLTIEESDDEYEITVEAVNDYKLIRPVRIGFFFPGQTKPSELMLHMDQINKPIRISKKEGN